MHDQGIAHRDIKVENILLDNSELGKERALLCDFGFATDKSSSSEACGTLDYAAPEVLTAHLCEYDPSASDIWSAGVVFYVMLTGMLPFDAATKRDIRYRIAREDPKVGEDVSHEARSLLLKMMKKFPGARPTASECLASALFK